MFTLFNCASIYVFTVVHILAFVVSLANVRCTFYLLISSTECCVQRASYASEGHEAASLPMQVVVEVHVEQLLL